MIFYGNKFKEFRKQFKMSMETVSEKLGVTRKTLGVWESGKRTPSEVNIRLLAQVLSIPVNEISDLPQEYPSSDKQFSKEIESWLSLANVSEKQREEKEHELIIKIKHQQNELRQATTVINALLESMHSVFYVKDKNLKYVTANHAFLNTLSLLSTYRVLGKTDEDFFPANEAKQNHEEDYQVILTGKAIVKNEGYIPGSRKKKWALVSKIPIFDSEGKISGLAGSFLDITDIKKAQANRELLEANVNYMTEALTVTDITNRKYLFMNKAKEKLFGYSSEIFMKEGPGYWMENCVHPDDREEQIKYRDTFSWPKIRNYRIVKPDGEIRWVETRYAFPDKKLLGKDCALTLSIDITDRKKNDDIIKLLELTVSDTDSIAFLLSPSENYGIKYVSESINSSLGYDSKKIVNENYSFLNLLKGDCIEGFKKKFSSEENDIKSCNTYFISFSSEEVYIKLKFIYLPKTDNIGIIGKILV